MIPFMVEEMLAGFVQHQCHTTFIAPLPIAPNYTPQGLHKILAFSAICVTQCCMYLEYPCIMINMCSSFL